MAKRCTLHGVVTSGHGGYREYQTDWNGHHYVVSKEPGYDCWMVTMDGEDMEPYYWIDDIRRFIEAGEYEKEAEYNRTHGRVHSIADNR